ncbi:hypothetical protein [Nocardia amamiensis]|uniref:hypothetical protein n=1 Tax=Nocardia amamiensis TaxID=404578 RepID=UPI000836ED6B|nr:hypothetical protein [Nocardia amamiensis]
MESTNKQSNPSTSDNDDPRNSKSENNATASLNDSNSPSNRSKLVNFNQNFYGSVMSSGGHFGIAGATPDSAPLTGKLSEKDILVARKCYVQPDGYAEALTILASDHVVLITGRRGLGKRSGAISLLREITGGPLRVLSPTTALQDLAKRPYEAGHGYLVAEYSGIDGSQGTEFDWHAVRDQVREAGAWLVLTAHALPAAGSEVVRRIAWRKPETKRVVAARLVVDGSPEVSVSAMIEAIETTLPPDCSMHDLIAVVDRVLAGDDIAAAHDVLDESARNHVQRWFDGKRGRRQVLEVATLCFLGPSGRRSFESELKRLTDEVASLIPVPDRTPNPADDNDDHLPETRLPTATDEGLIQLVTTSVGDVQRQLLEFRSPAYHQYAVAELWARLDVSFWDGIRDWLRTVIITTDSHDFERLNAIATGAVVLGMVEFTEADELFLQPWSRAECGWSGQSAAVYALWIMCTSEPLAPIALRTAVRWATHGDSDQRLTAALAFSGPLGIRYPEEATERLWQLIAQSSQNDTEHALALAALFATLVSDAPENAEIVLRRLNDQYDESNPYLHSRVVGTMAEVLAAREYRSGKSAMLNYLVQQPEQVDLIAQMWAYVLRERSIRIPILDELLDGLNDLTTIAEVPDETARTFGTALAAALTTREASIVVHDLDVRRAYRKRQREQQDRKARRTGRDLSLPISIIERDAELERLLRVIEASLTARTPDRSELN